MTRQFPVPSCRWLLAILLLGFSQTAPAKYIGGQAPKSGCACSCSCTVPSVAERSNTSTTPSRTERNLMETVPILAVRSRFGPTINLSFTYNSYNADNSQATLDTVAGYGWTHSYNLFLFSQLGSMYRYDGDGRVTRYALNSNGAGYTTAPGYFETLVKTGGTTFTITEKTQTVYTFEYIPGTPFVLGGPVYRLTQIADRNGNTTTLTYTAGNLTQITDTYGRTVIFTYSAAHKITSVKDALGRITTFQYDSTGHMLTGITDPNGHAMGYTYNSLYQLTSKTDKAGRLFHYTYNSSFAPAAVTDANGTTPATLSNPNNWATDPTQLAEKQLRVYLPSTTTTTDGLGRQWQYQYDANGYITRETYPDGHFTIYQYDPNTLQLASMTDANGNTTSYLYNSSGDLTQVTDAMGHITQYTYDPTFHQVTSMTDPLGRVTTYTLDAHGNRIQESDPPADNPVVQTWAYDTHGNVTSHVDPDGNVTRNTYDSNGNLSQQTDAFGTADASTTMLQYDPEGNLVQLTDPRGFLTKSQYDGMDRRIGETDAAGTPQQRTLQTTYDGEGNRTEVIDGRGITTRYAYDLRQRLTAETDASGVSGQQRTTTTAYDADDNRITVTDPLGRVVSYEYDTRNRLVQETDATGTSVQATTTTAYDPDGNIISRTDADSHTTTYSYDALNRRISMTDALNEKTLYFYDGGTFSGSVSLGGVTVTCDQCGATPGTSLITGQVDPDGTASQHAGTTYTYYDALNRVVITDRRTGCLGGPTGTGCATGTIDPAKDAVTLNTYDAEGNRLTRTEPDGNTTTDLYDHRNRIRQETDAAGDVTVTTYDGDNNVVTITAPNGNITTNTYDPLDRLTGITDLAGSVAGYSYDADNNRITQTDGDGNVTTNTYDSLNRLTTSADPLGKTMRYSYDSQNNLLSTTDRNGSITNYTFDALNRRTLMTDALGNTTRWAYDAVGNLVQLTDANGNQTRFNYDPVNRPLCETYADATTRCFTYDPAGNLIARKDPNAGETVTYIYSDLYFLEHGLYAPSGASDTFTYDLSGRMLTNQRTNGAFTWPETFQYDGANRLLKTQESGQTITYAYDIPHRIRTVTYPGGRTITETTDYRARLQQIDDGSSPPPIVKYTYDSADNVLSRNYPRNGTTSAYTYNANNWTLQIAHQSPVTTPATFAGFNYAYDNEGNRLYEVKVHDLIHSECYSYDRTYRLINYQTGMPGSPTVCPPTPATQIAYNIDAVGNICRTTDTCKFNTLNEEIKLNAATIAYSADGNPGTSAALQYQFDEENRLTSETRLFDDKVCQYQYDAMGRRVLKVPTSAGACSAVSYYYDAARIIEEQNGGVTQATYVYGNSIDEILTMDRGGQTYYYHANALGSVEAITDSTANPVERYTYDAYGIVTVTDGSFNPIVPNAWGAPHSAIGNPWLFTGRQFDEETGLYYYRARSYDPREGRFLQRDPLEYSDGANLYEYVSDRPTFGLDPSGLNVWTRIRFWYNASGGNGGIGNPYFLGIAYPVGRVDINQEVACSQDAGHSKGGMAIANTASDSDVWEYGTAGSATITKRPIRCGPDILGNSYPGVNVTIEAKVSYTKGALSKHLSSAITSATVKAGFGRLGPFSLATTILSLGYGFYNWVYDFESFKASATISYDVCCQCCANGGFKPAVFPVTSSISLKTDQNQLAIAASQQILGGCNQFAPKQTALYTLNAGIGAAKKALANKEHEARVSPGLVLQQAQY